jgi:hypothetical protein
MIESRGAQLRHLELMLVTLDGHHTALGVRSLLQACASTLREMRLYVSSPFESAVEVAEVLVGCAYLDRLDAPISTFAVLPPGRPITFRLVHLTLSCELGDGFPLSSVALWGLMARGGFPHLESLDVTFPDWRWGAELGPAMVAAFEGVAGTLKALTLTQEADEKAVIGVEADGVLPQLGEAIGKLRRLETLDFDSGGQGFVYHRIAQGLPEGACPALWSLTLAIVRGAAWLACEPSIILPSVQKLQVDMRGPTDCAEALALACTLKSLEYRGYVSVTNVPDYRGERDRIRALLKPFASGVGFD